MGIFQVKSRPFGGDDRAAEFWDQNYVCIGYTKIGDLTGKSKEDIRAMFQQGYPNEGPAQVRFHLGVINAFVNTIVSGRDLILVEDKVDALVYVGIAGDYHFVNDPYSQQYGLTHRRHVQWLRKVPKADLVPEVQELLRNRPSVTQFKYPQHIAKLDWVFEDKGVELEVADLSAKALDILKADMDQSTDPLRRTLAAAAILRHFGLKGRTVR